MASVNWGVAGRIAVAWTITLPAAAVVGAAASWLASSSTVGTLLVAVTGLGLGAGIYAVSRRNPVSAHNVNDISTPPQAPAHAGS